MSAPLRVVLGAFGTLGEIHPFIAIGRALQARGHEVRLVAPAKYAYLAQANSMGFASLVDDEEFERFSAQKYLWHPQFGYFLLAKGVTDAIERGYRTVLEQHAPGRTVLVMSWMFFGGRIAQETHGIPGVTLDLSPLVLRSLVAPPAIPPLPLSAGLPAWWNGLWYGLIDASIDSAFAGPLNQFRAGLGLPPLRRVIRDWVHSPDRIVGLFPDWFAPPPTDWPPQTALTGFPLYDEAELNPLSSDISDFLDRGPPPVAVTIGTGMRHAEAFLRAAIAATQRLRLRAVVLAQRPEQAPRDLPEGVFAATYAPHSTLLPGCAAIIHHGGIGTTAQALRAGVPQLVVPATFDQADNGARLTRLGVGAVVPAYRFHAVSGAEALRRLLRPQPRAACAALKTRVDAANALSETVAWIERTAARK